MSNKPNVSVRTKTLLKALEAMRDRAAERHQEEVPGIDAAIHFVRMLAHGIPLDDFGQRIPK